MIPKAAEAHGSDSINAITQNLHSAKAEAAQESFAASNDCAIKYNFLHDKIIAPRYKFAPMEALKTARPSMAKTGASHLTTQAALEKVHTNARAAIRDLLIELDPEDPKTLPFWVTHLLKAQFEQKDLADHLRVSRATISRWAQDQTVPRSPGVRKMYVDGLRGLLDEAIGEPKRPTRLKPAEGWERHQRS